VNPPRFDPKSHRLGISILDTIERALSSSGLAGPEGPAAGVSATVRQALSTAGLMPSGEVTVTEVPQPQPRPGSSAVPGTRQGRPPLSRVGKPVDVPSVTPADAPSDARADALADPLAAPLAPGSARGAVRAGRPSSHVFSNAAGSRMYRVYRPAGDPPGRLPAIVMLHGCTQSAADFEAGTQMNRLADLHGFIVVYPEQPPAANASRCWNWFSGENQARDRGEPSLIAGITREVLAREACDPHRVFIAGLSAGGAMAVIMAETYPDLYAAAGVHSGLPYASAHDVPSALSAMRSGRAAAFVPTSGATAVPVIVFHGDSDPTVHPSNGLEIVARAGKAHAARTDAPLLRPVTSRGTSGSGRQYTRTVHEGEGGHAPIEAWTLHGAGHAWSGGHASGSHTYAAGPDASAEMVRFFLSLAEAPRVDVDRSDEGA